MRVLLLKKGTTQNHQQNQNHQHQNHKKHTLNQYPPKKRQKKSIKKILFLKNFKKKLVY